MTDQTSWQERFENEIETPTVNLSNVARFRIKAFIAKELELARWEGAKVVVEAVEKEMEDDEQSYSSMLWAANAAAESLRPKV